MTEKSILISIFVSMKQVDCIVIGQGIAGTLLSFELIQAGLSVQVIDAGDPYGASRVASGVINPVTGRRVVETWKIDQLLPLAIDTYNRISTFLKLAPVIKPVDVLAVHGDQQMRRAYEKRYNEGYRYIREVEDPEKYNAFFNQPHGLHAITQALLVDLQRLLPVYRDYLASHQLLSDVTFKWDWLQVSKQQGRSLIYEDGNIQLKAKWLIAAEGTAVAHNPYFKELAFRYNKGEALIIAAPKLPRQHIYKLRYSIVPWGDKDLFWIGSTYQWEFDNVLPTGSFRESVMRFLDTELRVPYQLTAHIAAVRPATVNRRPFSGWHREYPQLGILNGLGTKGCSLAPYLAAAWKDHLLHGRPFDQEITAH